jgi:hypothetical protein
MRCHNDSRERVYCLRLGELKTRGNYNPGSIGTLGHNVWERDIHRGGYRMQEILIGASREI